MAYQRGEPGAADRLYELFRGTLEKTAAEIARKAAGRGLEKDDLLSEMHVLLFEAARSFDPSRGSFEAYMNHRLGVFKSRFVDKARIDGGMPPSWSIASRVLLAKEQELAQALGRTPTLEEIREAAIDECFAWAAKRVLNGVGAGRIREFSDFDREVAAVLAKQGTLTAVANHAGAILAGLGKAVSLDAPVGDGDGSLGDLLPDREADEPNPLRDMFTELEWKAIEARFLAPRGAYQDVADELGVSCQEARRLVASASRKPQLPHAQWAYLSGVALEEKPASVSGRTRARIESGGKLTFGKARRPSHA